MDNELGPGLIAGGACWCAGLADALDDPDAEEEQQSGDQRRHGMAASAERPRQGQGEAAEPLPDRDAAANPRVAASAAAPLRQVTDHRNQFVRGQATATGPAVGRWPQEGLPAWQ